MVRELKVSVTLNDILEGKRLDGSSCPVAFALERATGKAWVHADYVTFRVTDDVAGQLSYVMPREVENWIRRYDDGVAVRPTTFIVPLEDMIHRHYDCPAFSSYDRLHLESDNWDTVNCRSCRAKAGKERLDTYGYKAVKEGV